MAAREKAVMVAVATEALPLSQVHLDLDELAALLDTAGADVVGRLVQKRGAPDPATYLGRGKVEELRALVQDTGAGLVAFDGELTPAQVHHLEEQLPEGVKVLDRAAVILDIFALRARSREAKLQVELAQLEYLLPRLTRRWQHLSRQAGGIGTRGVGETQLEIDRRVIRQRVAVLKRALGGVEKERWVQRRRRQRVPSVALVGYTNAGKSALFSRLSHVETLVEDRLFATLDPLVRRARLGQGLIATVADTVGFIRKLPHQLVASFRATLLEAVSADLLVHLVDVSSPRWREQLRVGEEVLESLGVDPAGCLLVLNKVDRLGGEPRPNVPGRTVLYTSCTTGEGVEELRGVLAEMLIARGAVSVVRLSVAAGEQLQQALACPDVVGQSFSAAGVELYLRRRSRGQ
ncbi:MAG: GTPase HflX [Thermoanaerobaculum sp.]|nr:GTPase HflX [Thermoanaerobaculum sp.]MDW7968394.1 GTPase HflX [Thermoanaerobaculum sp.]